MNELNGKKSPINTDDKKPKPYFETNDFPQMKVFDDNYIKILEELHRILEEEEKSERDYQKHLKENGSVEKRKPFFELWCETNLYEESNPDGWNVAPLMINYKKDDERCKRAPFLHSLVDSIPGLITVSFSMLKPGTWIVPHKGYENYATVLLRYHLGLVIPNGDLGLRVEKKIKVWEEGKSFIFDDALTHEAWNFTDKDRYVLIIDFARNSNGEFINEKINFEICSLTDEVKAFINN